MESSHGFIYHDKNKINLACSIVLRGKGEGFDILPCTKDPDLAAFPLLLLWEMFLIKMAIWDLSNFFLFLGVFLRKNVFKF